MKNIKKNKILSEKGLRELRKYFFKKKIVLCHGVFDILHIGHINYFKEAKKLGDLLVVSVTDDGYVNKGPGRPAFPVQSRLKFLSEIQTIDFVYVSKSPTARNIILNLKPRYYCKGNDYPIKNTILDDNLKSEIDAVKKIKGKYKQINQAMFSSSKIINDYNLQNLNNDAKKYITEIRKKNSLSSILNEIGKILNKKVLVLGETIIDKYISTETIGKSGKEPILVIKPIKETNFLGGAAYVANLCSSFCKTTKLISFIGSRNNEKNFISKKINKKVITKFFKKNNSPTINKMRYVDEYRKTKILGVYDLNDDPINLKEERSFYNEIKKNIKKFDIVIVLDYGHGIFTKKIRKLLKENGKKIYLNTQINSFNRGYHTLFNYNKINSLIINESELKYELKDKNSNIQHLVKALRKKVKVDNIIITRGKNGSVIVNKNNKNIIQCPAFNLNNKDTVGAGDTFFAMSAIALSVNIDPKISLLLSSIAADFSIDQIGKESIFDLNKLKKYSSHVLR